MAHVQTFYSRTTFRSGALSNDNYGCKEIPLVYGQIQLKEVTLNDYLKKNTVKRGTGPVSHELIHLYMNNVDVEYGSRGRWVCEMNPYIPNSRFLI